jgi:glucose-1-phosphate thymidylyltransferase
VKLHFSYQPSCWGIIPAAGTGSRIQPLAFSKELLPVGSRVENGVERPKAVSEYLLERLVAGGVEKICFVISPGKSDILSYYGDSYLGCEICYRVQPQPSGLADSIFRALSLIQDQDTVIIGLPDTIWFPSNALQKLSREFSLLLFPVKNPSVFDSVVMNRNGEVSEIEVKNAHPTSHWIWGALKMSGHKLKILKNIWEKNNKRDLYIGSLINSYIKSGGKLKGVKAGESYVDVGTIHGYREAVRILSTQPPAQEYRQSVPDTEPSDNSVPSYSSVLGAFLSQQFPLR